MIFKGETNKTVTSSCLYKHTNWLHWFNISSFKYWFWLRIFNLRLYNLKDHKHCVFFLYLSYCVRYNFVCFLKQIVTLKIYSNLKFLKLPSILKECFGVVFFSYDWDSLKNYRVQIKLQLPTEYLKQATEMNPRFRLSIEANMRTGQWKFRSIKQEKGQKCVGRNPIIWRFDVSWQQLRG